jgi:hypothetical protein
MEDEHIGYADATSYANHTRFCVQINQASGAQVVDAHVDGRDAAARVIGVGPDREAAGDVGEGGGESPVEGGPRRITNEIFAKRDADAAVTALCHFKLHPEEAIEGNGVLHDFAKEFRIDSHADAM